MNRFIGLALLGLSMTTCQTTTTDTAEFAATPAVQMTLPGVEPAAVAAHRIDATLKAFTDACIASDGVSLREAETLAKENGIRFLSNPNEAELGRARPPMLAVQVPDGAQGDRSASFRCIGWVRTEIADPLVPVLNQKMLEHGHRVRTNAARKTGGSGLAVNVWNAAYSKNGRTLDLRVSGSGGSTSYNGITHTETRYISSTVFSLTSAAARR